MKSVSELYGRHAGSDIYVVGTGASLRVFPRQLLEGRITIGLNMAWKHIPVTYGITAHPDLNIPEFIPGAEPRPEITWIVKREKLHGMPREQVRHAEAHFYSFRTGRLDDAPVPESDVPGRDETARDLEWVRTPTENFLYLWTSISQPAVNLAANLGARNVILVGCDNAAVLGNHHAHDQHTRWLGVAPEQRYLDYYEGLAEMRPVLRERGVDVVSLTPFLRVGPPDEEFLRLCTELGVEASVDNPDITTTYEAPWQRHRRERSRARLRRPARAFQRWASDLRRRARR
jgi:hypothetical protein